MIKTLQVVALVALFSMVAAAATPEGWYLAGSKPKSYEANVDPSASYGGQKSVAYKAIAPVPEGFGTLMQHFAADNYVGKRVRLSAFVKTQNVERWAGLWMRVDGFVGGQRRTLSFDNMEPRALKGTLQWAQYEVVLDVPQGAAEIYFGILVEGPGTVWMNSVKIEVVGNNIPLTGKNYSSEGRKAPPAPVNLSFDK